jgi:hypothetical protein
MTHWADHVCHHVLALSGESVSKRQLQHYTVRLRHSQRLRYRLARHLVIWLPLLLVLYALLNARTVF